MTVLRRVLVVALFALALWPEFPRYLAEWRLAEANVRLGRALSGNQAAVRAGASTPDGQALRQAELAGELVLNLVNLVVVSVDGTDQEVVGDVVKVTTVLEPLASSALQKRRLTMTR